MVKSENWLDLSHYQTVRDWDFIAAHYEGVILKITGGNSFVDPKFAEFYREATKRGLKVRVYHFGHFANEIDARFEADFMLSKLGDRKLYRDECVCDLEVDDHDLSDHELTACLIAFAKEASKKGNLNTICYTYPNFLKTQLEHFNLPLWLADYSSDGHYVDEFSTEFEIVMVQYTSSGHVQGIAGNVDLDREIHIKPVKPDGPIPKPKEEDDMLKNAVVIGSFVDFPNAEPLAVQLDAPIYMRDTAEKEKVAEKIYVCGGQSDGLKGSNFVDLSGHNRYATAENIKEYLDTH